MPNLGELLVQNIAREKQAAADSAAALEQMRTEKARREFQIAQRFFDDARQYFINGITQRKPVSELYRQVGGKHYSRADDYHDEFDAVMHGHQYAKDGPTSLYDPQRFASLWTEFQQWAEEQGLVAMWHYCWDGGGMDSWWQLRVTPAVPAAH